MPALDLMPSGMRCAPWGEWLQGPESPCGTSAQRCSLQDRAENGFAVAVWARSGSSRLKGALRPLSDMWDVAWRGHGTSFIQPGPHMPSACGPMAAARRSRDGPSRGSKPFVTQNQIRYTAVLVQRANKCNNAVATRLRYMPHRIFHVCIARRGVFYSCRSNTHMHVYLC